MLQNGSLTFTAGLAEELLEKHRGSFDLICCMEVLEHVPRPDLLISTIGQLLKPSSGLFIGSTINNSLFSRFMATTLAESILGLLEPGTHDPNRFLHQHQIRAMLNSSGMDLKRTSSMVYVPFPDGRFMLEDWYNKELSVNYLFSASNNK